jgi:hypothetical protein
LCPSLRLSVGAQRATQLSDRERTVPGNVAYPLENRGDFLADHIRAII